MMEVACRDRFGVFNATFFKLWSCSMCYTYLFHDSSPAFHSQPPNAHLLAALPPPPPPGLTLEADVDDPLVVDLVCGTLDPAACGQWTSCCRAAEQCCQEQSAASLTSLRGQPAVTQHLSMTQQPAGGISFRTLNPGGGLESSETSHQHGVHPGSPTSPYASSGSGSGPGFRLYREAGVPGNRVCPSTWDGYGCFQATQAGHTATIACPHYINPSDPHARAYKQCTENGTWWRTEDTGQEWTDYTSCVQMETFRILYYVAVTCNAISLLLLVPACVIFLCYHKLREQHRVQIHLQLFASFILTNVVMVLWENLVFNDRLHNPNHNTLMYKDTVGCKILYVLTRYAWNCNFCWMFLEGFHLHRLIVKAFETPKSILGYYLVGWGGPWFPVMVYSIIRAVRNDNECWVKNIEGFEWIIYTPSLLCIAVNLFFLLSILRILLTQLTSHPNEPSNYRRALKATAVLVPLFGLQLFLVIYWPHGASPKVTRIYEVIASVVKHSQGALVALIFCFFNKEVLSHLKQLRTRCRLCFSRKGHELKGLSSHTYVMTERGVTGHNGVMSRSPGTPRGQYVAVTTQDKSYQGVNGDVEENFV